MAKTVSSGMQAHVKQEITTLATCWKITTAGDPGSPAPGNPNIDRTTFESYTVAGATYTHAYTTAINVDLRKALFYVETATTAGISVVDIDTMTQVLFCDTTPYTQIDGFVGAVFDTAGNVYTQVRNNSIIGSAPAILKFNGATGALMGTLNPIVWNDVIHQLIVYPHPTYGDVLVFVSALNKIGFIDCDTFTAIQTVTGPNDLDKTNFSYDAHGNVWYVTYFPNVSYTHLHKVSPAGTTDYDITDKIKSGQFMTYNRINDTIMIGGGYSPDSTPTVHTDHYSVLINASDQSEITHTTSIIWNAYSWASMTQGIQADGKFYQVDGLNNAISVDMSTLTVVQNLDPNTQWGFTGTMSASVYDPANDCWIGVTLGNLTRLCGGAPTPGRVGTSLGFTDHDTDLWIDGFRYQAANSIERSAIQTNSDLSVDNLDVKGILNVEGIDDNDILAGVWDYAICEVFIVNWADESMGIISQRKGRLGEISMQDMEYQTELRGLDQAFTRPLVELTTPDCRADLFDSRCQLNHLLFAEQASVGGLVQHSYADNPTAGVIWDDSGQDGSGGGTGGSGGGSGDGGGSSGGGGGSTGGSGDGGGTVPVDSGGMPTVGSTTTLANETGNNTSTASNYCSISNTVHSKADGITRTSTGCPDINFNQGPANISKVSIRSLLYPNATTHIAAHHMPWFVNGGSGGHIDIGYESASAAQVKRQIDDAVSRGIQSFWIDYYGSNNTHSLETTKLIRDECNRRSDFQFATWFDVGAITDAANLQTETIRELNYAADNFWTSSKHMRRNGRPLVGFFGYEKYDGSINWNTVRANIRGNPLFIFRNSGALNTAYADGTSDGAYLWLNPGQGYDIYNKTWRAQGQILCGSAAKGFYDLLATWGDHRLTAQNNGLFWLGQMGTLRSKFSASQPLEYLQLVTWNDWEEGTAIECGVDNHVTCTASITGTKLNFNVSGGGGLQTINHFTVFLSTDHSNLTVLANVASNGTLSYDLAQLGPYAAGTYYLYVKAVGRPCITNHMSSAVTYVKTTASTGGGGTGGGGTGGGGTGTIVPSSNHVYLYALENHSYAQVLAGNMPYLQSLISKGALLTNYYANYHPSIANYFNVTAGSAPSTSDGYCGGTTTGTCFTADNLLRRFIASGKTWKAYCQGLPSTGYIGGDSGTYTKHHNPFAYFSDILGGGVANGIVNITQLPTDIAGTLPNFGMIVPDNTHNAHSATLDAADTYMSQTLPALLNSAPFRAGGDGVLFIWFDESISSDTTRGGGHTFCLAIGPGVKQNYKTGTAVYQEPNLLATICELLGVSKPGAAASAVSIKEIFG